MDEIFVLIKTMNLQVKRLDIVQSSKRTDQCMYSVGQRYILWYKKHYYLYGIEKYFGVRDALSVE
jgi:hypothetical protein